MWLKNIKTGLIWEVTEDIAELRLKEGDYEVVEGVEKPSEKVEVETPKPTPKPKTSTKKPKTTK